MVIPMKDNSSKFLERYRFSSFENEIERTNYWLPAVEVPAFKMEVAAAKMRTALLFGISFSILSQCWM
jgi:hypothetical protein